MNGLAAGDYYLRVYGYGANTYTLQVTPPTPAVVPAAPTGVIATKGTYSNEVVINWSTVSAATAYDVFRNITNNSATATQINGSDLTTTTYDDTTAVAGTTYYYWIKAKNTAGS